MKNKEHNKVLKTIIDRKVRWYAIYVKSRQEYVVNMKLNEKGIKSYLPVHKVLKLWSDRKKWVEEPMFKSYIFVYIGLNKYNITRETEGVVGFVSFGGFPEPIPNNHINMIKKMLENDMEYEVHEGIFATGDKVKVIKGPLIGHIGEMIEYRGKFKVVLRMDMIGQYITVTIPGVHLQKAE